MGIIKCKIESEVGSKLLMNSTNSMDIVNDEEGKAKSVMTKKQLNPKEEAEQRAYRMKSGNLYIPSTAIKGALVNASSWKTLVGQGRKMALKPFIAGGVIVMPEQIDLGVKDYDVDKRSVVIRATKGRVIRYRPTLEKWSVEFDLIYNEEMFPNAISIDNIHTCLVEAGTRIGILDFRPAKSGNCGMFKVTKFEVKRSEVK